VAGYTALRSGDVEQILARYAIVVGQVEPLSGGAANSSYLVRATSADYVLTVLDNHDEFSARRLGALLTHLVTHEVPTGRPIKTVDGDDVSVFSGRPVLVKEYLPGHSGAPLPAHYLNAAGRLLAEVHAVPVPKWLPVNGRRLPQDSPERMEKFRDAAFVRWLRLRLEQSRVIDTFGGPVGLVHGDYFADNLVVCNNNQLAVLDWETATRDLLVLDIGMAIVGLCRQDGKFLARDASDLLTGYESRRPLGPQERETLRPASIYACLVIAYHRYLRHNVTHPDPDKRHLYLEIPDFVQSLEEQWSSCMGVSS
jgi:homoserine kinase type II